MADKRRSKPPRKRRPSRPTRSELLPDVLSPGQAEARGEEVVASSDLVAQDERRRRDDLRFHMLRSVLTEPLLSKVQQDVQEKRGGKYDVIVSLNELYWDGIDDALELVEKRAGQWKVGFQQVSNYVFACLGAEQLLQLANETHEQIRAAVAKGHDPRRAAVIYRIWEDSDVHMSLTRSLTTVKADAAQRAFHAHGKGILWAVLDSGVSQGHPHFQKRPDTPFGPIDTLAVGRPVEHRDYTPDGRDLPAEARQARAQEDRLGHGTHVAGIIAGYWRAADEKDGDEVVGTEMRNEADDKHPLRSRERLREIHGVAPQCRIVSLKVIADRDGSAAGAKQTPGQGKVSWILLAIADIQEWNQNGKRLLVHGVNMSLGYDFDPRWFACGESPLCVEVNRLVKSGVVVVVSAGNGGFTAFVTQGARGTRVMPQYNDLSITDPGNAEQAITVGSTHKEMPHRYGVSYFSSRGPTGDGRRKPDLLAPGERIVSCAVGQEAEKYSGVGADGNPLPDVLYCEQSGTSMAAPHVSGAAAAFLSVRTEFIGQPERLKSILMETAIDLRREPKFQGAGLLDVMKALQAV